jgi:hypothetical protein
MRSTMFIVVASMTACSRAPDVAPPLDAAVAIDSGRAPVDSGSGAPLTWATAYAPGGTDGSGNLMEGTELRALVAFNGALYAGIGYWEDTSAFDPTLPGAQVLRLDAPDSGWQVDLQVDTVVTGNGPNAGARKEYAVAGMGALTLTTDSTAAALTNPVSYLAATTWVHPAALRVWTRPVGGAWEETDFPDSDVGSGGNASGRAFATHRDSVTGVALAFTGSDYGIYSGAYVRSVGDLVWNLTAETWTDQPDFADGARVMSFAECNGALYTTVGAGVFVRHDGPSPSWSNVYTATLPSTVQIGPTGGLRGITCVRASDGSARLIVAVQGPDPSIVSLDPAAGFADQTEVDLKPLLEGSIGAAVHSALVAYNDMTPATDPMTGESVLLIGCDIYPQAPVPASVPVWVSAVGDVVATAHYFVRHADGTYGAFGDMEDPTLSAPPPRVAVRTIAVSPFAADGSAVVYAGGFDANSTLVHNTAWALRGSLAYALGH